jgi:hypothetical protein
MLWTFGEEYTQFLPHSSNRIKFTNISFSHSFAPTNISSSINTAAYGFSNNKSADWASVCYHNSNSSYYGQLPNNASIIRTAYVIRANQATLSAAINSVSYRCAF